MKKFKRTSVKAIKSITCDRCAVEIDAEDMEFSECTSISYRGGYKSIFGDGCDISIDLCQNCVREVLGKWLTIAGSHFVQRSPADLNMKASKANK